MKRMLDLSKVSTPQLLEIRTILASGVEATAETAKAKRLKQLEAENARLQKLNERREIVESAGLEWDEDYFMHFNDKHFMIAVRNISNAMKQAAIAEASRGAPMRIPQMLRAEELSGIELVRKYFSERRDNGRKNI